MTPLDTPASALKIAASDTGRIKARLRSVGGRDVDDRHDERHERDDHASAARTHPSAETFSRIDIGLSLQQVMVGERRRRLA